MPVRLARGPRHVVRDRALRRLALVVVASVLAFLSTATAAWAVDFGVDPASFTITSSSTQAGAHADVSIDFSFNADPATGVAGRVRTIIIDLPPGLIGDPHAAPVCSRADFNRSVCPLSTQVGAGSFGLQLFPGFVLPQAASIFNLAPTAEEPAAIGITIPFVLSQAVDIGVRTGSDYGLSTTTNEVAAPVPIASVSLTLWGVPADHGTGVARRPFMTNPTSCSAASAVTVLRVDSYGNPGDFKAYRANAPTPTGCSNLPFVPSIKTLSGSRVVDSSGPFSVDIVVPQNQDPDGLATANLKTAAVTLPEGVSINPSLAHDLTACTDGAFGLHSSEASQCPAGSKIGRVGIATPLLASPIPGDIYVGEPQPGNPFRLFIYADGSGVRIKLEGSVHPDPTTGRLTAVFDNNPQIPFSDFHLEFQGGSQAVLAMPTTCGSNVTTASLAPWSGQPAIGATDMFLTFGDARQGPCQTPQPFKPSFSAGVTNANAGQDTTFAMKFGRADGQQALKSLKASLPPGLLAHLASFPQCPKAVVDAFAKGLPGGQQCPDSSLVGDTIVSAGAGDAPLNIEGKVWLTEPFSPGQIAGLAIFVPAAAGPYYLGNVVVRVGLYVRPDTGVDVLSDPLPTILEGIPLRIQQVIVNLDRSGFMFTPTNCSPKRITATITSTGGVDAPVSSPFGLNNCAALPFRPQMDVGTASPHKAGGPTGLDVNLRQAGGEANLKTVRLTLPKQIGARLEGPVQTPCEMGDWFKGQCAADSRVGHAVATTPILPFDLTGNVHFLANPKGGLPKLGIVLTGGPVHVALLGDIEIVDGRLQTTIDGIPDVPISHFELVLEGGSQAALSASSLCDVPPAAYAVMTGQNGKVFKDSVRLDVLGCGAQRAHAKSKRSREGGGAAHRQALRRRGSVRTG